MVRAGHRDNRDQDAGERRIELADGDVSYRVHREPLAGAPDAAVFLAGLQRFYVFDNRADLLFRMGGSLSIMFMVKENGAWKLGE